MTETKSKNVICVLDDDPMVSPLISKATKFETISYEDPEKLLEEAVDYIPTAAFIDVHLGQGKQTGIELIPILKEYWRYIPIIVITSSDDPAVISQALASGADDFIKKPIIIEEVVARLQVRLKNSAQIEAKEVLEIGDIKVDVNHRAIEGPKGQRFISPTEINLLMTLINSKGTVINKDALKSECWGQVSVSDNALHRKLHAVRQAVSDVSDQVKIKSVYGVGFSIQVKE